MNDFKKSALGALVAVMLLSGCKAEAPLLSMPATQPTTMASGNKTEYAYTYDDQGRIIEKIQYQGGVEFERQTRRYDEAGNLVEEALYQEGVEKSRSEYVFDDMGNVLESNSYEDGVLLDWQKCAYNSQGLLIREELPDRVYTYEYEFGDRSIVTEKRRYLALEEPVIDQIVRYDSMLNIVEQIQYNDGAEYIRDTFDYSNEGLLLCHVSFTKDVQMRLEEFTYINGKKATEKRTDYVDSQGNAGEFVEYLEYDGKENVTLSSYVVNGKEQSRKSYAYDAAGRRTLEAHLQDGTETERHEWSYDGNGNMISHSHFSKGLRIQHDVFSYDGDGNMVSRVSYDGNTAVERWIYTYDHYGNVVEESCTELSV